MRNRVTTVRAPSAGERPRPRAGAWGPVCSAGLVLVLLAARPCAAVDVWLTRGDQASLLEQRPALTFAPGSGTHSTKIQVDPTTQHQLIDGFGASLTDSSAWLIQYELSAAQRSALMQQLFSPDTGIGISFVRIPMGASDFALTAYTYDDRPPGQTDPNLLYFSIAHDESYIIPTLLEAIALRGDLKVMASPWSPPAWMKNTQTLWGGSLQTQYYDEYAQYFVRFVQAYAAAGVPIHSVTPQNEPLNATTAMPAATMQTYQQSAFVGDHLDPAFATAGISTKILVFDHNWSDWNYPVVVLNDPQAGSYAAGAAFHGYEGDVAGQSDFHTQHPDAEVHFTEISGGGWAPTSPTTSSGACATSLSVPRATGRAAPSTRTSRSTKTTDRPSAVAPIAAAWSRSIPRRATSPTKSSITSSPTPASSCSRAPGGSRPIRSRA